MGHKKQKRSKIFFVFAFLLGIFSLNILPAFSPVSTSNGSQFSAYAADDEPFETGGTGDKDDETKDDGDEGEGDDGGSGGATNSNASCFTEVGGLSWILCWLGQTAADAITFMYEQVIEPSLRVDSSTLDRGGQGSETYKSWQYFQSFANILFVIFTLIVVFSQVTGIGISNLGIKRVLPRLIVAIILINLSYLICQLLVDVSNILGMSLKNLFDSLQGNIKANGTSMLTLADFAAEVSINTAATVAAVVGALATVSFLASAGTAAGAVLLILPTIITAFISVLVFFCLLAARQAGVIILTVVSPIAIALYMLPNTKSYFDKYVKLFSSLLFMYPIAGLIMGASNFASTLILVAGGGKVFSVLTSILIGTLPFFFIPSLVRKTMDGVAGIGTLATNWGRKTGGNLNQRLRDNQTYQRRLGYAKAGQSQFGKHEQTRFNKGLRNFARGEGRVGSVAKRLPLTSGVRQNMANKMAEAEDARAKQAERDTAAMARLTARDKNGNYIDTAAMSQSQGEVTGENATARAIAQWGSADAVVAQRNKAKNEILAEQRRTMRYADSQYTEAANRKDAAAVSNEAEATMVYASDDAYRGAKNRGKKAAAQEQAMLEGYYRNAETGELVDRNALMQGAKNIGAVAAQSDINRAMNYASDEAFHGAMNREARNAAQEQGMLTSYYRNAQDGKLVDRGKLVQGGANTGMLAAEADINRMARMATQGAVEARRSGEEQRRINEEVGDWSARISGASSDKPLEVNGVTITGNSDFDGIEQAMKAIGASNNEADAALFTALSRTLLSQGKSGIDRFSAIYDSAELDDKVKAKDNIMRGIMRDEGLNSSSFRSQAVTTANIMKDENKVKDGDKSKMRAAGAVASALGSGGAIGDMKPEELFDMTDQEINSLYEDSGKSSDTIKTRREMSEAIATDARAWSKLTNEQREKVYADVEAAGKTKGMVDAIRQGRSEAATNQAQIQQLTSQMQNATAGAPVEISYTAAAGGAPTTASVSIDGTASSLQSALGTLTSSANTASATNIAAVQQRLESMGASQSAITSAALDGMSDAARNTVLDNILANPAAYSSAQVDVATRVRQGGEAYTAGMLDTAQTTGQYQVNQQSVQAQAQNIMSGNASIAPAGGGTPVQINPTDISSLTSYFDHATSAGNTDQALAAMSILSQNFGQAGQAAIQQVVESGKMSSATQNAVLSQIASSTSFAASSPTFQNMAQNVLSGSVTYGADFGAKVDAARTAGTYHNQANITPASLGQWREEEFKAYAKNAAAAGPSSPAYQFLHGVANNAQARSNLPASHLHILDGFK